MDETIKQMVSQKTIQVFDGVAGHSKSFYMGNDGTLLKRNTASDAISEADIMQKIMGDVLRSIIPQFYGVTMLNNVEFIRMEHLTQSCPQSTSIMDVKLGSKTYLKSEENTKQRRDLYQKMIRIDDTAPSESEMKRETISKYRYLEFRDTRSTTRKLKFRIEGVRLATGEQLERDYLSRVATGDEVKNLLNLFITTGHEPAQIASDLASQLRHVRDVASKSLFFKAHSFIGTSLLFILCHDRLTVKLIDFAKVRPATDSTTNDEWLLGLDNLIRLTDEVVKNP